MTDYHVKTGALITAPTIIINGENGAGYLELNTQDDGPEAPASGVKIYSSAANTLSWKHSDGIVQSLNTSNITNDRVWELPDANTKLIGDNTTDTLSNKTLLATDGNIIEATHLGSVEISGSPDDGDILKYDAGSNTWLPLTISATSPLSYTNGELTISVGGESGTVAAGDDARLSTPQVIKVKTSNPGYGEFTSIKSAIESISDASSNKPYTVYVSPGVYVESAMVVPSWVSVSGSGAGNETIVVPADAGPLFTLSSSSALNSMILNGNGTDTAIEIDGSSNIIMNNLVMTNFHTFMYVSSSAAITSIVMFECILKAPFTYGIIIDGTNITSFYECSITISQIICPADEDTESILLLKGPLVVATMSNFQCYGATNGTGITIEDGANVIVQNSQVHTCDNGIHINNTGFGPVLKAASITLYNCTGLAFHVEHPGTTGVFNGIVDREKVSIDSSLLSLLYTDPTNSATVIVGDLVYSHFPGGVLSDKGGLLEYTSTIGVYSGGALSYGPDSTLLVSAGEGYIATGTFPYHQMKKVTWGNSSVPPTPGLTFYVYVGDSNSISSGTSMPNPYTNIVLGRVRFGQTEIEFIDSQRHSSFHYADGNRTFMRNALGVLYSSGSIIAANASRELAISSGKYYYLNNEYAPSGLSSPATWSAYYHASGTFTYTEQSVVSNTQYDNGSDLTAITAGKYVKHGFYIVGSGSTEKYFLVYGQELFDSQSDAIAGDMPTPPNYFSEGVFLIGGIIVQEGVSTIDTIIDLRPTISSRSVSTAGTSAHGDLSGLLNDDHPQYLLVNGSRAMEDDLDMGSNNITGAGTINGVNITTHASRHLPNGADPLTTAAPSTTLSSATTNAVGVANSLARSDHTHAVDISGFSIGSLNGTLSVAKGGTGATTLTSGNFLVGNGTSAVNTSKSVPTGDVIGTTDTQTLSNKSLISNNVIFIDDADDTKNIKFSISGATTNSSMTISSAHTDDRVLTLPDVTDTLVSRSATETLSNKTLSSSDVTANIIESSDYIWAVGNPDAVEPGPYSMALLSVGNISHTQLGDVGSNTHTDIDAHISSTENPHNVTFTQAHDADPVCTNSGDMIYWDGDEFARIAAGSSRQCLILDSSLIPTWSRRAEGGIYFAGDTSYYQVNITVANQYVIATPPTSLISEIYPVGAFTMPADGRLQWNLDTRRFRLRYTLSIAGAATSGAHRIRLRINDVEITESTIRSLEPSTTSPVCVGNEVNITLNTGDYIDLYIDSSTTSADPRIHYFYMTATEI